MIKTKNMTHLLALLILMASTSAQASVGRVLFTFGSVSVERPVPDTLTKGMPVDEGEVIVTGGNGYVQLLLDDNTKVAVRPNSRFAIDAVEMPAENGFGAIGAGTTPQARFSLQRGGFRTLTGRIASAHPSAYRISTPNAVVGVRGTNYVARLCNGDCGPDTPDGLFIGVTDGAVFLSNDGGDLDLLTNQFGFAANFRTPPIRLVAPPVTLQDEGLTLVMAEEEEAAESETDTAQADADEGSEDAADGDAEEAASEFGGATEVATGEASDGEPAGSSGVRPDQGIAAVAGDGGSIDLTDGGTSASVLFAISTDAFAIGTRAVSASLVLDEEGFLTGFQALGVSNAVETFDIGSALPHNNGFDPESELRWGRWSEGIARVDGVDLDLGATSLHFVSAVEQDTPSQLITGSAEYVLVGNTDPTDNLGNIGVLGSASLLANFTDAVVQSDIQLGINGQVWQAIGTGDISSNLFSGLYNTVSVDAVSGGSGTFGGLFSGFPSDGTPLGAGMTYNLTNGNTTVNGAAVFNQVR